MRLVMFYLAIVKQNFLWFTKLSLPLTYQISLHGVHSLAQPSILIGCSLNISKPSFCVGNFRDYFLIFRINLIKRRIAITSRIQRRISILRIH